MTVVNADAGDIVSGIVREEHRPGYSLPRAAYTDAGVFASDIERVFLRTWLFVSASAEVPAGSYATWSVGGESVVLTRTADAVLHAHHNVCRHRGSRLLTGSGGKARMIVCGYHSWTYGLDGALRAAGDMGEGFRERCGGELGLRPVHVREVAGLVFVCFAEQAPPFEGAAAAIADQLGPHEIDETEVIARFRYRVAANWKTLVENNRECYHCRPNHPEFCLSNYELGVNGDGRVDPGYEEEFARQRAEWREQGLSEKQVSFPGGDFYRVARLPLRDGFETESLTGRLVAPLLGRLTRPRAGSVRVVTLPNSWSHVNADYAVTTRLTPVSAGTTDVDLAFLVRGGAIEGVDYRADEVVAVWKETSEQDWELCERNFAGVRSRAYLPGPLSPVTENSIADFHQWWFRQSERD